MIGNLKGRSRLNIERGLISIEVIVNHGVEVTQREARMRRVGASVFTGAETSLQGRRRKSCLIVEIQRVCDVAEIEEEKVQRDRSSQECQILQRGRNTRCYGEKSTGFSNKEVTGD